MKTARWRPGGAPPPMELDLDSLLRSHGASSGEESPSAATHHRSVDDILNETDSYSPTSPSSPIFPSADPSSTRGESESSIVLERLNTEVPWRVRSRELSSLGLLRSYSASVAAPPPLPPSYSLPPLFSRVRPSPKPGAALAAAAAASRAVPTPHAAAIKSRWASASSIQKSLEFAEEQSDGVVDDSERIEGSDISEAAQRSDHMNETVHSSSEVEFVIEAVGADTYELNAQLEVKEDSMDNVHEEQMHSSLINENGGEHSEDYSEKFKQESGDSDSEEPKDEDFNAREEDTEKGRDVDINKLVEQTLSQLEISKADKEEEEKKLRASMKPLELAEELEKRQAYSALHWEEGAAAQPMRLEGIRRGPPAVGYLQMDLDNAVTRTISSQTFRREHGSPQVLTVHTNFIALGMSKGALLVFPSKYSIHSADNMDGKMLMFGYHGEKSHTPVTSMCFNHQGDLLLVGYGDGHLAVWDVQKATAVKIISGEHNGPVVHTLFLGHDFQVTRQFRAVTGDSKGLVMLHTFSVVPLLNRFSIKTQCLLDGRKTGTVLSASTIIIDDLHGTGHIPSLANSNSASSLGNMMGGVVGGESGWKLFSEGSSLPEEGVVIFVTHQNALVVRLGTNVEVYEKFTRPDGVREGSMPYTAWKCTTYSRDIDASDRASWLVIAWDRKVQVAKLVKSEMKRYKEWTIDSATIGVAWLDDQMLLVLTMRGQLILFAKDGIEIHRTSFVVNGSGMDDIITYHSHFMNTLGNPEKAYHNSVAVRGASVYILGHMHLIVSRLLPWKERIQVLRHAGDWMGALDMAMRLYDGQAHGVIDLPRMIDSMREIIMPYLVELLFSYVDEVFSYISVAFGNQLGKVENVQVPELVNSPIGSEIVEQYARVGGVAVEYCVHIKRNDILFDNVFSKFIADRQGGTFLEILEPYILKDMLGCLPPEIMQALVEHYTSKGWLQRVEQCILHMDISSLDFNQVVRLCREKGLCGALIYLFNRGLDDFRTPLEELLAVLQSAQGKDRDAVGYRMLVYLKYCFSGFAFPPGHGTLSPYRLPSLRRELLQYLLEDSKYSSSQISKNFRSFCGTCPNICHLLCLDTESTLEVLKCAFQKEEAKIPEDSLRFLAVSDMEEKVKENAELKELVQSVTNMLILILDLESDVIRTFLMEGAIGVWPSEKDLGHLFEFIVFLVTSMGATISERLLKHILEGLTSRAMLRYAQDPETEARLKEKQVLALLKVVPQTRWSSYMLQLCTDAQFHQACGFLNTIGGQYVAALDCYMRDVDEPIHAFAFINKMLTQLVDAKASSFRSAVMSRIPILINLSRECTFFLVLDHFSRQSQQIIANLHPHPESLFLFLKTAMDVHLSGTLSFPTIESYQASYATYGRNDTRSEVDVYVEKLLDLPKLLHNTIQITDEITELYLELLCQYDRKSVLKFLQTFDSYRLEHCLRLCQEHDVTDAAAFLLERVGDVGSALLLLMTGLKEKFDGLVVEVQDAFSLWDSIKSSQVEQIDEVLKMGEVAAVHEVLRTCIGLCQRNTERLNPNESESLWFQLLNMFSEPLRRLCVDREVGDSHFDVSMLSTTSDVKKNAALSDWKMPRLKHASILRRVFSLFIGEIIEGMVGYVALPAIMAKLLVDNASQEFGIFKLTILRMLGIYGYERNILTTAKSLIEDDTFYTMSLLKKGALHAYAPQAFLCCECGCSLSKESSYGIRVYSCGHSTHLSCESDENEASGRGLAVRCPICQPKTNIPGKNGASLLDNGSVKNSEQSVQTLHGVPSVQHYYEPEILERPYVLQQVSRFKMLSNLQKDLKAFPIDYLPHLRLCPPAIYHEKVRKHAVPQIAESSNSLVKEEKPKKRWQVRNPKSKGSSIRSPLKSNIFGEVNNKVG